MGPSVALVALIRMTRGLCPYWPWITLGQQCAKLLPSCACHWCATEYQRTGRRSPGDRLNSFQACVYSVGWRSGLRNTCLVTLVVALGGGNGELPVALHVRGH